MQLRSIFVTEEFGFVAFQEGEQRECWFFHSQEQARTILYKALEDSENSDLCNQDIANSELPEESETESLCIEGRAGETLSHLITPIANFSAGNTTVIFEDEKTEPLIYFLLTPRKEDTENPNALLGLRDDEGNHSTFILYSKKQGREVLKAHCSKMQQERVQRAYQILNTDPYLPEESAEKQIKIGDPVAAFLHNGYVMMKQAGG